MTTSANQTQATNDDRNDRSAKKGVRSVIPLRTNKATFVHFTPPHKVITPSSAASKKDPYIVAQRSISSCASLGPTPTCIRMRSGESSNFRIENFSEGVARPSIEDPAAVSARQAQKRPQKVTEIPISNSDVKKYFLQNRTFEKSSSAPKKGETPVAPVNIWEMLFYDTNIPADGGIPLTAPTVASSPVAPDEILKYIGNSSPGGGKCVTTQNITGACQNLPSILATGSLVPSSGGKPPRSKPTPPR
uniref:Uncharacterized protein n=1 Tax=Ciona savignyi TaxID=51511 RepID=H2Y3W4_CIOSA